MTSSKPLELFEEKRRQYLADYLAEKRCDVRSTLRPDHIIFNDLDLWLAFLNCRWTNNAPLTETTVREFFEHLSWIGLSDPDFDFTVVTWSFVADKIDSVAALPLASLATKVFQEHEGVFINENIHEARKAIGFGRIREIAHEFNEEVAHPDLLEETAPGVRIAELVDFVKDVAAGKWHWQKTNSKAVAMVARMGEIKAPDRAPGMSDCPHGCGGEIPDHAINCFRCGKPVNRAKVDITPSTPSGTKPLMSAPALVNLFHHAREFHSWDSIDWDLVILSINNFTASAVELPVPFPQGFLLSFLDRVAEFATGTDLATDAIELHNKIKDRPIMPANHQRLWNAAQAVDRMFNSVACYFPLSEEARWSLCELKNAIEANADCVDGKSPVPKTVNVTPR